VSGVDDYLAALPADRREALQTVRDVVCANLADGFAETIQYGMISWVIPLERYPDTYNGQALAIASLASQKRHMALYLNCTYADAEADARFRARWAESGKQLDMGKSCVRFRRLDDVALDAIGETIAATTVDGFIAAYERSRR
jgi:hypothetical protein